jgi:hypothetical protein
MSMGSRYGDLCRHFFALTRCLKRSEQRMGKAG